jgi:FeS assembly SUF system regulator
VTAIMLRLSKKADYALIAMKYLAGEAPHGTASAREIAERYDIPIGLLAKVLQQLTRRGFLASRQGIHGGYDLARSANTISVADIIQAIDGPLTITACSSTDERCGQFSKCIIRNPLWRVRDRIVEVLQTLSLSEMARGDEIGMPSVRLRAPGRTPRPDAASSRR